MSWFGFSHMCRARRTFSFPALALALACAGAFFAPRPAHAGGSDATLECTFSITDIDFGNINILAGGQFTTGTLEIFCWWGTPNGWATICPNLEYGSGNPTAWNPRQMARTANYSQKLDYQLYHPGTSVIWGSYHWPHPPKPPILHLRLDAWGLGAGSVNIDARVLPGQTTVVPGQYASLFSGKDVKIAYRGGRAHNCSFPNDVVSTSFQVRARVIDYCEVAATDLDFGIAGLLDANIDATGSVRVRCTNGTNYRIGLNGGLSGASSPDQRRMSNGPHSVRYGIYRDAARTLGWGDQPGNSVSGVGNGHSQTYTTYGRVFPQPAPPPGTYTDTIVVTVTY